MSTKKFRFNPHTLSYEPIEYTTKDKVKRSVLYFLSSVFSGVVAFFVLVTLFQSPREKQLVQENKRMLAQYNLLDKQLDELSLVMADLQQRDDNLYRVIYQAEPIPLATRMGQVNKGAYYDELAQMTNSQLVADITHKTDVLRKQMYVQSKLYDEIVQLAKQNETRLEYIPAIQPVLNKDLKRTASGYGWRIDPIYHARRFHAGMDFTAPTGTDVYATGNATVKFSGWRSGYGNCVILNHGFGYETLYAHLYKSFVHVGQKVKRRDVIGLVGNTGKSTGPHLHYEVHFRGQAIDPRNYYFQDLSPEEYDQMVQLSENTGQMFD